MTSLAMISLNNPNGDLLPRILHLNPLYIVSVAEIGSGYEIVMHDGAEYVVRIDSDAGKLIKTLLEMANTNAVIESHMT